MKTRPRWCAMTRCHGTWPSLDQAIMAHRDLRKRRGDGALKQGPEFRMKSFTARCGKNAELMEGGHCWDSRGMHAVDGRARLP